MNKFLLFNIFLLSISFCHAQIFNNKCVMDKFDDVVDSKNIKTLITRSDSSFFIEEKGNKPVEFVICGGEMYPPVYTGSKEEIVNLVQNIYGYQEEYCVIYRDSLIEYRKLGKMIETASDSTTLVFNEDGSITGSSEKSILISKQLGVILGCLKKITHRVVVNKYTKEFISEYYWVTDDKENRTIYSNN